MEGTLRVKGGGGSVTATVLGATRAFPRVRRIRLGAGRFFDAEDEAGARRVAVLGARVAERLFGDEPVASLIAATSACGASTSRSPACWRQGSPGRRLG